MLLLVVMPVPVAVQFELGTRKKGREYVSENVRLGVEASYHGRKWILKMFCDDF